MGQRQAPPWWTVSQGPGEEEVVAVVQPSLWQERAWARVEVVEEWMLEEQEEGSP